MIVREIKEKDLGQYSKLIEIEGGIFHSVNWLKLFPEVRIFGVFTGGDNLIAGFHLREIKYLFWNAVRNAPLTPSMGPIIKYTSLNYTKRLSQQKKVLEVIIIFLKKEKFLLESCIMDSSIKDTMPFLWNGYKIAPHYTYKLDISNKSSEEVWKMLDSDKRNIIRKARKDGVKVVKTNDYNVVEELVSKTFQRQGMEVNKKAIEQVLFTFANSKNSFATVAYKNDKAISSAFILYSKGIAYYLLGGYDTSKKHNGAGALCIWEAIEQSLELGIDIFDFEGSVNPPIEKFFRGFGGELVPMYRYNRAWLPVEIILKFFKRSLF